MTALKLINIKLEKGFALTESIFQTSFLKILFSNEYVFFGARCVLQVAVVLSKFAELSAQGGYLRTNRRFFAPPEFQVPQRYISYRSEAYGQQGTKLSTITAHKPC